MNASDRIKETAERGLLSSPRDNQLSRLHGDYDEISQLMKRLDCEIESLRNNMSHLNDCAVSMSGLTHIWNEKAKARHRDFRANNEHESLSPNTKKKSVESVSQPKHKILVNDKSAGIDDRNDPIVFI